VVSKIKPKETLPNLNASPLPVKKFGRLEIPLKKTAVLDWLPNQPFYPRWYWAERDQPFEMAGAGSVLQFNSPSATDIGPVFQEMSTILQNSQAGVRFYGGMRFTTSSKEIFEWKELGSWFFFIPKFEIISSGGTTRLIYNYSLDKPFNEHPQLVNFKSAEASMLSKSSVQKISYRRREIPSKIQWQEMFKKVLKEFRAGKLKKIVLARKSCFEVDSPLDPLSLFSKLCRGNPQSFAFFLQPEQGLALVGISPERLYHRQQRMIRSEAIAGTRPRGKNPREDEHLAAELLHDPKELNEHGWVKKDITRKLKLLCLGKTDIGPEEILKLTHVQHICTRFQGHLRPGITDAEIIRKLHPTPAVAGYPKELALRRIGELEPFDRGWYAGPIGWLEKDSAEFAVALRCAVVKSSSLLIYAGAGIVPGSDVKKEWKEIDSKILNYTKILSQI
jgi:menaquinone-specific isochorismate synthase